MKPQAFYNEIDPQAAQWLRNLIKAGHIAPGFVDERSIEDITPYDLREFTQVHLFAGIGTWSYALRRAGWGDERRVWTASCPCQPFSAAGKGGGFDDERHLWPSLHWLLQQCRPAEVIGEQVASKAVDSWIDLVQADMEALDYAFWCSAFPAAGVGAPHIRDRTYWHARYGCPPHQRMGHADSSRLEGHSWHDSATRREGQDRSVASASVSGGLADSQGDRYERAGELNEPSGRPGLAHGSSVSRLADDDSVRLQQSTEREFCDTERDVESCSGAEWLADSESDGRREERADARGLVSGDTAQGLTAGSLGGGGDSRPGPTNGHWRAADWLHCRDGKWRPVEPGTFPLVDGAPSRVVRLRAYGNGIVTQAAEEFIRATM